MSVLVLGGAGYIGSVVVEQLAKAAKKVVVYDNLSRGYAAAVDPDVPFVRGDIADAELLENTIREHKVESVMHFCAYIKVGESVEDPLLYYNNNVKNGLTLLEVLRKCEVKQIIFSSTAAIFGDSGSRNIDESAAEKPSNPYGRTKLMFEKILRDCSDAYGLRSISLRYFNACGASERFGEAHVPETHLIPLALEVAQGKREALGIFGRDYPTDDGTCVRDYIHVSDLAAAHLLALEALKNGASTTAYNLGNGHGFSVLEVIRAAEEITCRRIPTIDKPRRAGDSTRLVASSDKIREELRWHPQITELRKIIESAWKWKQAHPNGYKELE